MGEKTVNEVKPNQGWEERLQCVGLNDVVSQDVRHKVARGEREKEGAPEENLLREAAPGAVGCEPQRDAYITDDVCIALRPRAEEDGEERDAREVECPKCGTSVPRPPQKRQKE